MSKKKANPPKARSPRKKRLPLRAVHAQPCPRGLAARARHTAGSDALERDEHLVGGVVEVRVAPVTAVGQQRVVEGATAEHLRALERIRVPRRARPHRELQPGEVPGRTQQRECHLVALLPVVRDELVLQQSVVDDREAGAPVRGVDETPRHERREAELVGAAFRGEAAVDDGERALRVRPRDRCRQCRQQLDAVRPGLALYEGAATVTAPLAEVHHSKGPAGYTGFLARRHGVILAGYSNSLRAGPCLVNGRRSRVIEVGMQSAYVEAAPPDRADDEVVLLGDGLTEAEVAAAWGTSPQEVLVRLTRLGPREYVND